MPIIQQLTTRLGTEKVLLDEAISKRYHHIWYMHIPLKAKAVIVPASTEDLAAALQICHEHGQQVVVHGGLTNLVGGTQSTENQIIISTEKLNTIQEVDVNSRTMTVQAGVVLEQIQQSAKANDLQFPLNFGAKGSAQIGGIIATNAGGLRVLKYGMTRQQILGLEVVLADGTVLSNLKKIIKDNSGYDLKQLFIGSEGTLGIVTRAVLRLGEMPKSRCSAWVGIDGYKNVVAFLKYMDRGLGGTLSAYELVWQDTFRAMTGETSTTKPPLPLDYQYYVLTESLGSDQSRDAAAFQSLLESALEKGLIKDGVVADNSTDLKWFWQIREDVRVLSAIADHDHHFDISLPIPLIGEYVEDARIELRKIPEVKEIFNFGHVADGNIHFIIGKKNNSAELTKRINDIVYEKIATVNGSVSAEHGIGLDKKAYLHHSRSKAEIELMKTIKRTLDPKNILNPGRIIDL